MIIRSIILCFCAFSCSICAMINPTTSHFDECFGEKAEKVSKFLSDSLAPRGEKVDNITRLCGLSGWGESFKLETSSVSKEHFYYVLRVCSVKQPLSDRIKELFLMRTMGDRGISPKVISNNSEDLGLMEFIQQPEPRPWTFANRNNFKLRSLALAIRQIHDSVVPFFEDHKTEEIDKSILPLISTNKKFSIFNVGFLKMKEVEKVLDSNVIRCLCHNDLGSCSNVLWDGSKAFIIDWETASTGNPYFDIAAPVTLLLLSEEQKLYFFSQYLGHEPTHREYALLYLTEQYSLIRHGLNLLSICKDADANFSFSADDIGKSPLWSEVSKGTVKIQKDDLNHDVGRCKIALMLVKQAVVNIESEKYNSMLKNIK